VTLRSPIEADAPAVFRVIAARDTADLGFPDLTLDDLLEVWRASEFDLAADAAVVQDELGRIVAYADVQRQGTLIAVDPAHDGHGADRQLLAWSEHRERARGHPLHRQRIGAANLSARELLLGAGYGHVRHVARMVVRVAGSESASPVPPGVELRAPNPTADAVELHALDALAFGGAPDYVPESLSQFSEEHLGGHDHDPSLGSVALVDGRIVGFVISRHWPAEGAGYISILAVHPDHRRRGIATAMLRRVFAAYASVGLGEAQLTVASDNPSARRLYEGLGMTERFRYEIYERPCETGSKAD
jgi:ribosomal protein S18 acetylase RimI-like enzyme